MRRTRKEIFVLDHRGAKAPLFHGNRNGSHARFARGTDEGVRPYTIILAGQAGGPPFQLHDGGSPILGLSASGESSASYADFMPWADAAKILKRKQVSQFQG